MYVIYPLTPLIWFLHIKSDAQIRPQISQLSTSESGHKLLTVFFVKTVAETVIQPFANTQWREDSDISPTDLPGKIFAMLVDWNSQVLVV